MDELMNKMIDEYFKDETNPKERSFIPWEEVELREEIAFLKFRNQKQDEEIVRLGKENIELKIAYQLMLNYLTEEL